MIYGLLSQSTSFFYNLHVAAGITRQGRSSISSAILLFESFLDNNVHFASLTEIVEFIHNVINEPRKYDDKLILDRYITMEETFYKLMSSCGFNGYIPSIEDMNIIWDMLQSLTFEDWNRLFYKNNLFSFCENQSILKAIEYILGKLDTPFLDPNKAPEEVYVELEEFKNILKEYVYYGHMWNDKIERVATMIKAASILTDTDSSMISLDGWYRFVLQHMWDKPFKIKDQILDEMAFVANDEVKVVDTDDRVKDYNFFTDEFTETMRAVKQDKIVVQDGFRYSIINIMLYVIADISTDYMRIYSKSYNAYGDDRCYLKLKNELLMKRILLQEMARKHYAYNLEMQEGHLVPEDQRCGITGMEMKKFSLQESVRTRLKEILYNDILSPDVIDQRKVLVDLIAFEREIYESLAKGETKYHKPTSFKSLNAYDNPLGQQSIKGALVYNATKDPEAPAFNLEEKNYGIVVKVRINPINAAKLQQENNRVWEGLQQFFKMKQFKDGITSYTIPHEVSIPTWLLEYIDYYSIINDNIKNFPLESIGLVGKAGNESVNHSNILRIM